MKSSLKNYRQSPRKVRLVTELIKGKKVSEALILLNFLPKRAAAPVRQLLKSAVANASARQAGSDNLVIKDIRVDGGVTQKRMMPRARGSAARIKKRSSHIRIVLS